MKLREKKAARTKVTILEKTVELIGGGSFNDLKVDEICDKAEISSVTFFKYFPRKEDVLVYFLQVWDFHRDVEQLISPKRGIAAIRNLFRKVARQIEEKPGLMLSLIGFMANLSGALKYSEVSIPERKLLYPENEKVINLEVLPLPAKFERHIKEAISDGELPSTVDSAALVKMLVGVWHGAPITAHIIGEKNLYNLYETHLDALIHSQKPVQNGDWQR